MNKILALLVVIAMMVGLSACGAQKQGQTADEKAGAAEEETEEKEPEDEEASGQLAGGWEIADNDAAELPEEVQSAFDKAVKNYEDAELKPVAYVASQLVAGFNYMVLCEAEKDEARSYQMVIIYADLQDNAKITAVKDFDLAAYTEASDAEISQEEVTGGWTAPEKPSKTDIPEEASEAFGKAAEKYTGNKLEPMALLGTQVVAGTNYAFICKAESASGDSLSGVQIVTVYADLDGNAEISNICTIDPAEFNGDL